MLRALQVTSQGYHQWRHSVGRRREREAQKQRILDQIRVSHSNSFGIYGRIRIHRDLQEEGIAVSEKTVGKIMREEGIRSKTSKKFKATTNSNHKQPVSENILDRDFTADSPNQKWVGDITYIGTDQGWLYLAVVIDLFSRKVVGWSLGDRMTSDLVCNAMNMAITSRGKVADVLCHFDRGSQYASHIFQALLKKHGFTCSMSRRGNCWDNAVAESFFRSLKVESIYSEKFQTRNCARTAIFKWLECFYNTTRRHSSIGYVSPLEFERRYYMGLKAA